MRVSNTPYTFITLQRSKEEINNNKLFLDNITTSSIIMFNIFVLICAFNSVYIESDPFNWIKPRAVF